MKKIHKIEISTAVALVLSMLISILGFGMKCADVRNDVIRLHILANSDSSADQTVKLAVRDALLESGEKLFSGAVNKENAKEALEEGKERLLSTAEKVLHENGFDYGAKIYLTEEYFQTRSYENFTLPAGKYLAVKVILGNGNGHNWWCVMFPPLCLPAAAECENVEAVLGNDGTRLIKSDPKYEVRFKIIEVLENLKNRVSK